LKIIAAEINPERKILKAVHRVYAKRALVKIPYLEHFEKLAAQAAAVPA